MHISFIASECTTGCKHKRICMQKSGRRRSTKTEEHQCRLQIASACALIYIGLLNQPSTKQRSRFDHVKNLLKPIPLWFFSFAITTILMISFHLFIYMSIRTQASIPNIKQFLAYENIDRVINGSAVSVVYCFHLEEVKKNIINKPDRPLYIVTLRLIEMSTNKNSSNRTNQLKYSQIDAIEMRRISFPCIYFYIEFYSRVSTANPTILRYMEIN